MALTIAEGHKIVYCLLLRAIKKLFLFLEATLFFRLLEPDNQPLCRDAMEDTQ